LDVGQDGAKGGRRSGLTSPEFSLFVGNLDYHADEVALEAHVVELMRAHHTTSHILRINREKNEERKRLSNIQSSNTDKNMSAMTADIKAKIDTTAVRASNSSVDRSGAKNDENADATLHSIPPFVKPIINCKLSKSFQKSKGYGLVEFANKDAMYAALDAIKYSEMNGRPLIVEISDKSPWRGSRKGSSTDKNKEERYASVQHSNSLKPSQTEVQNRFQRSKYSLYVGNIDISVKESVFRKAVEDAIGANIIQRIRLAYDKQSGKFRGFGHIDFHREQDADDAVEALTGISFNGRPLNVNISANKNATS
jgi:RNA recognition motif-containing protein